MITPETLTDEMVQTLMDDTPPEWTTTIRNCIVALARPCGRDRRSPHKVARDLKRWRDAALFCCNAINSEEAVSGRGEVCSACCGPIDENGECRCEECRTCLGVGRIRDGGTRELRRCLDCNGAGVVVTGPGPR